MQDLDEEYDRLMDELEAAVAEKSIDRGKRIQVVRVRIEDLLRAQMGMVSRVPSSDRRSGPNALH